MIRLETKIEFQEEEKSERKNFFESLIVFTKKERLISFMTDSSSKHLKRRWYDLEHEVSQAFMVLESFPGEILYIVTSGLVEYAEREFRVREQQMNRRSLGSSAVLALFKSEQRRRKNDRVPPLYKITNYMMILTETSRQVMATSIMELVGFIAEYLKECKTYEQSVEMDDVGSLTSSYLRRGKNEARRFMENIRLRFIDEVSKKQICEESIASKGARLLSGRQDDMRLGSL
ncbi:MAG: hypothetical protein VKK59_02490 [Vampirovibrionales bacterium]|nr:hypothetical protein [Vampirovibrionales bacterium]